MKTKKGKKKQRKVLAALLMLVLLGGLLGTTSYAWFTANKTVTVSTINVNVAAVTGLQISVDGINWKTVITNDDITGASSTYDSAVNNLPDTLAPVSTAGNIDTSGYMEMYLGEVTSDEDTGEYTLTTTKETDVNGTEGNYVVFDLFFQVQAETVIYLTDNSAVTAQSSSTDTGIQNATRIAFIDEGTVESGSSTASIQGLSDSTASAIFWEPNYDVHTSTGISNAYSLYGVTLGSSGENLQTNYGVKTEFSGVSLSSTSTDYFTALTSDIYTTSTGIASDAYEKAFTLEAGITKIRVYMWVEGQDVDCENNASGGSISFDVQFSSNESA